MVLTVQEGGEVSRRLEVYLMPRTVQNVRQNPMFICDAKWLCVRSERLLDWPSSSSKAGPSARAHQLGDCKLDLSIFRRLGSYSMLLSPLAMSIIIIFMFQHCVFEWPAININCLPSTDVRMIMKREDKKRRLENRNVAIFYWASSASTLEAPGMLSLSMQSLPTDNIRPQDENQPLASMQPWKLLNKSTLFACPLQIGYGAAGELVLEWMVERAKENNHFERWMSPINDVLWLFVQSSIESRTFMRCEAKGTTHISILSIWDAWFACTTDRGIENAFRPLTRGECIIINVEYYCNKASLHIGGLSLNRFCLDSRSCLDSTRFRVQVQCVRRQSFSASSINQTLSFRRSPMDLVLAFFCCFFFRVDFSSWRMSRNLDAKREESWKKAFRIILHRLRFSQKTAEREAKEKGNEPNETSFLTAKLFFFTNLLLPGA